MVGGGIVVTGRGGSARRGGCVPWGGAGAAFRFGSGAAVADGVSLLVGDAKTVGGLGVGGGGAGQFPGQGRVDRAQAGDLTGPLGQAQHGDQRDGQVQPPGKPGRKHAGARRDVRAGRMRSLRPAIGRPLAVVGVLAWLAGRAAPAVLAVRAVLACAGLGRRTAGRESLFSSKSK